MRTAAEGATREELERDVRAAAQPVGPDLRARGEVEVGEAPLPGARPRAAAHPRGVHQGVPRRSSSTTAASTRRRKAYVEAIAPELADRVEFYDTEEEGLPIFERFHIYEQLMKALDRKVWLPSGGSLVIERTEALTVIDVNTGKNVGRTNLEETVYRNNLEAAEEVARQLRLRDIGGIIVIDFIDMEIRAEPRRGDARLP